MARTHVRDQLRGERLDALRAQAFGKGRGAGLADAIGHLLAQRLQPRDELSLVDLALPSQASPMLEADERDLVCVRAADVPAIGDSLSRRMR